VISLLLLFGFIAQAGAQDYTFHRLGVPPKLRAKAGKTHKAKIPSGAPSNYQVLYNFCSAANCTDGDSPRAGLIQDAAGNLYGTTQLGGAKGGGTVFKVDNTGQETVLYSFCSEGGENCTDGWQPYAGLIQDAAGNLYGTTSSGGAIGGGTVFKLDSAGQETVLYNFCSVLQVNNCLDGENPYGGVIQDSAGNLYGTTLGGGANTKCYDGCGTVFKVDNTGKETVLYNFCSVNEPVACSDGNAPYAGLIQDSVGNLYGTTSLGGTDLAGIFESGGVVFKVDTTGHYSVLYSFCSLGGCTDGYSPRAGLIQDAAGNLYGTTNDGGAQNGGAVFKLDNTGHETVLYSFCSASNCTDGLAPKGGVLQDAAGNLYGTTYEGGANTYPDVCGYGCGAVFKLDNTGHETVLYNFCPDQNECTDGAFPVAGLVEDAAGNLYGTTAGGGASGVQNLNAGTVFKLATVFATVTLTSSPNPAYVDQSVTLSAVVSGTGATPTGSVTFEDGTTALGTVTLANGKASLTTTFTTAGSFSIVADYSGDQTYGPANSSPLTQVVDQYTTSTALASSLNPSTYGQAVTLSATVSSTGPTPTGTVTFKNGSKSLGSASLSGGVANLTISTLAVGTLTITASYGGDAANEKSTSPALKQVVDKATSTTTIVSSVNPSNAGQTVKITATVTSPTTTPTGTVTFKNGSTVLGTGSLAAGKASYSTSTLSGGSHNITAAYNGTANISGSTSPVLVQTVKYATSTVLASNVNPSTYGEPVTFTATVSSAGPTPTGTVTFKNGSKSLGSASLSGGMAKITTSTLPVGTLTIAASYGGDAANEKSTSPALKQVVDKATSTTTIVSSVNPSNAGQTVKFTATVTSPTTPTGTVTFKDGSTVLGTGTLASGNASYSTSTLSAGSHNITAVYNGTANISGSTSAVLVQTVN
jgi:uncharacterized repeat protein (TIGR03803 family)